MTQAPVCSGISLHRPSPPPCRARRGLLFHPKSANHHSFISLLSAGDHPCRLTFFGCASTLLPGGQIPPRGSGLRWRALKVPVTGGPLDLALNERGRGYHINCGPGDIAPYVLTCGDPARARKLAKFLDEVRVRRRSREFLTITGIYRQIPVTVMATGIGPDNTAIAIVEACQFTTGVTFIRLGSCGALQPHIQVGDLIITSQAIRDEHTSHYYCPDEGPVPAHPAVIQALVQAAGELQLPYHLGTTCTTADFYAGQGRRVPGFPTALPDKVEARGLPGS